MAVRHLLFCLFYVITFISYFHVGLCDRTEKKMYVPIKDFGMCFRRMNATMQIGCASSSKGNVGVLHYLEPNMFTESLDWLVNSGPHKPYIIVIDGHYFDRPVFDKLRNSGKVNGIMVWKNTDTLSSSSFSPDKACPNEDSDLYKGDSDYGEYCKKNSWNPLGNNLFYEDIDFPIFLINDQKEYETITNCYAKHNKPANGTAQKYPLCAAEMKGFMFAAKDTPTCFRRSNLAMNLNPQHYCDAIGGQSVYANVNPVNSSESAIKTIIAATRLDSYTMFDRSVNGSFDSPLSGIVTLLAAAEAIGRNKQDISPLLDIMFIFFQGEAFDYIGSNRVVYEMKRGNFPIKGRKNSVDVHTISLSNISSFIEVGQVGSGQSGNRLWAHSDPRSRKDDKIDAGVNSILDMLKQAGGSTVSEPSNKSQPLPPASFQSFLKEYNISGVVLTEYKKQFKNRFYHSRTDTINNTVGHLIPLNTTEEDFSTYTVNLTNYITDVAETLARTLYALSTNNSNSSHVSVNSLLVNQLLYCFTINPKCNLFQDVVSPGIAGQLKKLDFVFYTGTASQVGTVAPMVRLLLNSFLGDKVINVTSSGACKESSPDMYKYYWVQGPRNATGHRNGVCLKSTANYTEAHSPAFFIKDYDWSSGKYPSWSESSWMEINLQLFLVASEQKQTVTLSIGVIILLISMVTVYFINSKADRLFTTPSEF